MVPLRLWFTSEAISPTEGNVIVSYYLGLVPHHLFLWLVQALTKQWGKEWRDALHQGGYSMKVLGITLTSEWNDGRPSAEAVRDGLFGMFSENQHGSRKSFAISQYVVW